MYFVCMLRCLPLHTIDRSSAYPIDLNPLEFNSSRRLSMISIQSVGDRTPPCGVPLVAFIVIFCPLCSRNGAMRQVYQFTLINLN